MGEILRGRTIRRDRFALAGFLAACLAVSVLGGLVTASSVGGWYQALDKPPFNPPDWLFAPVWTGLYLMMALAAWRIWRHVDHPWRVRALALFAGQLALPLAARAHDPHDVARSGRAAHLPHEVREHPGMPLAQPPGGEGVDDDGVAHGSRIMPDARRRRREPSAGSSSGAR